MAEGGYSVALTAKARAHLGIIQRWWLANRPAAPDLFAAEFRAAARRVASAPLSVAVYRTMNGREIRRLLMPRTRYHLYFEVHDVSHEVFILAIWHGARGRAPAL
jgi:plasmid stabilization system protein ParE